MSGGSRGSVDSPARALRWLDRAALALVATAPLAGGGMWPPALALWSLAAILLCLGSFALQQVATPNPRPWKWEPLALALLGLATLELVRASTWGLLPTGAWEADTWALWPGVKATATTAPARTPLAALALLGLGATLQLFASRSQFGRTAFSRPQAPGQAALAAAGLAIVLGLFHHLLQADAVLGLLRASELQGLRVPLAAPLINENQAGALWGLGAILIAGRAGQSARQQALSMAGALGIVATMEWGLHAHTAALAALAGLGVIATCQWLGRRDGSRVRRLFPYAAIALASIAAPLVAWALLPRSGWGNASLKAQTWQDVLSALPMRPLGYGVGTFPDLAGALSPSVGALRATWIESEPLQLAFDHGWLPTLLLVGLAFHSLFLILRTEAKRSERRLAATAALAVFVITEAVGGMGLRAMAFTLPLSALWGSRLGRARAIRAPGRSIPSSAASARQRQAPQQRFQAARSWAGAGALLILTILCLPGLQHSVQHGNDHPGALLLAVERAHGLESRELGATIEALAQELPGDVVLISWGADRALALGDTGAASRWIDHATRWAPGRPTSWRLAAELAIATHDRAGLCEAAQRLLEVERDPRMLSRTLGQSGLSPREWTECTPGDEALQTLFRGLAMDGQHLRALALAMPVLGDNPDHRDALLAALQGAAEAGSAELGLLWGMRLLELEPGHPEAAEATALLARQEGESALAITLLEEALAHNPGTASLTLALLDALGSHPDIAEDAALQHRFDELWRQSVSQVAATPALALRRLRMGAHTFERRGDTGAALAAYRAILLQRPGDAGAQAAIQRLSGREPRSTP